MQNIIVSKFKEIFGTGCALYAAPGRVNLIGEHTDYNGGYVLPGAIDKAIYVAIKPNGGAKARIFSVQNDEMAEFRLCESDIPAFQWARYPFGVCMEMIKRDGRVEGFDAVVSGDVPLGAGLSSSAALCSAFAFALNDIFGCGFERAELALIGQSTEHNYEGVKCGIMDQFASIFGRKGNIIRLNCNTLDYEYIPFDPESAGYRLVLLDTRVKHELASSAYNRRRESCENAVEAIRKRHPEVEVLWDVEPDWLEEVRGEISAEDFKRAEYVTGEKQRIQCFCEALEEDDYETAGEMMYLTHEGLSKLYEVSCPELDFLNEVACHESVTGSRMMGGGFGGCTINLVGADRYDAFVDAAKTEFAAKFGHEPSVYDVVISDGARKL
ncbi:MAG: galactokinase [Bacteroidales bacterium]|nr:galactokinase [Bacteroidales bacterium]